VWSTTGSNNGDSRLRESPDVHLLFKTDPPKLRVGPQKTMALMKLQVRFKFEFEFFFKLFANMIAKGTLPAPLGRNHLIVRVIRSSASENLSPDSSDLMGHSRLEMV
jgi:hypothetical protein